MTVDVGTLHLAALIINILEFQFTNERGRSALDDEAEFSKLISKVHCSKHLSSSILSNLHFSELQKKNVDLDEIFEESISKEKSDARKDERDKARAINEHQKISKSLDNCQLCVDSKQMLKHLIVSLGSKVCLSLPSHNSLVEGHCILSPVSHVSCQTRLDEDVWEELQVVKSCPLNNFFFFFNS